MLDVKETKWWVSPFLIGGWWTRGVARETVLALAGNGEEFGENAESNGERWGSSGFTAGGVSDLETMHPMNGCQEW